MLVIGIFIAARKSVVSFPNLNAQSDCSKSGAEPGIPSPPLACDASAEGLRDTINSALALIVYLVHDGSVTTKVCTVVFRTRNGF
jgi:hypothetical protein